MNCNHPNIERNFQSDDIILTHMSSDLSTRWHTGGPTRTTKFEAATSTSAVAQGNKGVQAGKEKWLSESQDVLSRQALGAFHPCLLPMKPGNGGSLAFLSEALVSFLIPAHECLVSCDLGEESGYPGLLRLACNSRVWKTEVLALFLPLASCASLGKLLSLSELQLLRVHKKEQNFLPHMMVVKM